MLVSCGNNPEEAAVVGIDQALTLLTNGKCTEAIEILEDLEDQDENPVWIKTLASAYACKASINVIRFADNDISGLSNASYSQRYFSRSQFQVDSTRP